MLLEMLIAALFPVSLHFPSLCLCMYLSHMKTQSPLFLLVFGTQASLCSLAWLVIWHVAQTGLAPMTLLPFLTTLLSNKDTP